MTKSQTNLLAQKLNALWDFGEVQEAAKVHKKRKEKKVSERIVEEEEKEVVEAPSIAPKPTNSSKRKVNSTSADAALKTKAAAVPQVVVEVFDASNIGGRNGRDNKDETSSSLRKNSKHEWRQFMSSSIKTVAGRRNTPELPLSKKDLEEDKEDEANDKELMSLLNTTQLVKEYTSAELTGNERRKYTEARLVELGAKAAKAPKVSLPMHLGMKKAAQARVEKGVQSAKDMGVYTKNLKNDISKGEIALRFDRARDLATSGSKSGRGGGGGGKSKGGINGSVGRMKNGVMHVSKHIVAAVEGGSQKKKKKGFSKGVSFGSSNPSSSRGVGKKQKGATMLF